MRVSTFFAASLPEAIAVVRKELGPKAVVLSWRNTRGGIEISASAEPQAPERQPERQPERHIDREPPPRMQTRPSRNELPDEPARSPTRDKPLPFEPKHETLSQHFKPEDFAYEEQKPAQWAKEPPKAKSPPIVGRGTAALLARQGLTKKPDAAIREPNTPTKPAFAAPPQRPIAQNTPKAAAPQAAPPLSVPEPDPITIPEHKAINSKLARFWIKAGLTPNQAANWSISDDPQLRVALTQALSQRMRFEPIEAAPTKPLVLVGPPGSGKSAAVAKLATRALAVGYETLMISADSERCGGAEQLRALAERLGAKFATATTVQELSRLTKEARQAGQCILVDAAAASPLQPSDMRATKRLVDEVGLEPIVCIPADTRFDDQEDLAKAYHALGAKRAIITRLDLTQRRASVLNALINADLALAQISSTPFITGGVAIASANRLAAILMEPFDDDVAEDAA